MSAGQKCYSMISFCLTITAQMQFQIRAEAQGSEGPTSSAGRYLSDRQKNREEERWSFSNYLIGKNKLKEQDYLYRLYTDPSKKGARVRLEPSAYGFGETGQGQTGDSNYSFVGSGYGGSLYFNNFISGILKIPTPNVVLGCFAERREERSSDLLSPFFVTWGGSVRLFGYNQQDTALFLNYRQIKRRLATQEFKAWLWEAAARIYVAPLMSVEGGYLFKESEWEGKKSPLASHWGYWGGGALEIQMIRLSIRLEKSKYNLRNEAAPSRATTEMRRMLSLGIVI